MLLTWAGHQVSAANDITCWGFARAPAESLRVSKKPHYNSGQGWVCILTNMPDFPTTLCNMMKINGQLMPELIPAVVTHCHCKLTVGTMAERSDPDLLMSCRNLYRITESSITRVWDVSTWLLCFSEDEHLSSLAVHPSVHRFPEAPEGGRAAWWTSGTGKHPRQWYLIRLPHPSTGRRTMRERARGEKKKTKYVTSQPSKQGQSVRDESCVSCYPHSSSSFFYFDLRAEAL